jgi:hypothetical protein
MSKSISYYKSVRVDRNGWRESHPQVCMRCGIRPGFLEIHEILRRSRCVNWGFRANYLALCGNCHVYFDASNRETMTEALAIKKIRDPDHYDLNLWLRMRDERAMEFITDEEVERKISQIRKTEDAR